MRPIEKAAAAVVWPLGRLLPAKARQAIENVLEALSPGLDLEAERRLMIPLHNLAEPKAMKQFLSLLNVTLKAARGLHRPQ